MNEIESNRTSSISAEPAAEILLRAALAGGASRGGGGLRPWGSLQNGVVDVDENDEFEFDAERHCRDRM